MKKVLPRKDPERLGAQISNNSKHGKTSRRKGKESRLCSVFTGMPWQIPVRWNNVYYAPIMFQALEIHPGMESHRDWVEGEKQ